MASDIPPEHFPPRLAQLGFEGRLINGVEVILPPVCEVPAGEFLMGSDPKWYSRLFDGTSEKPQHRVTLPAFHVAQFPVTVAEYACFVCTGQPEPKRRWLFGSNWQTQLQRLDHPVVQVSWHDARSYASWLSQVSGQSWRLPTEAEWEKAARGTDGRMYPWGNRWDKTRANTRDGGPGTTTPVGSYPGGASPYGAQDVAGNVWEWTSSLRKSYPYTRHDGREDADSIENRVQRGSSWFLNANVARSSASGWCEHPRNRAAGFAAASPTILLPSALSAMCCNEAKPARSR